MININIDFQDFINNVTNVLPLVKGSMAFVFNW